MTGIVAHMKLSDVFFLKGYHKPRAFIASQGPLPDTADDFWRMAWEQKSSSIVMLTKEREGGRVSVFVFQRFF